MLTLRFRRKVSKVKCITKEQQLETLHYIAMICSSIAVIVSAIRG